QIVHRRTRRAQHSLLFHGSWFGISLSDNYATQSRAVFAGHLLPSRLAFVNSEIHFALLVTRLQENSPAVIRHLHVAELRPAVGFHADGRLQVHLVVLVLFLFHVISPAHVRGLPMFQVSLQEPVSAQIDVIGNLLGVIDRAHL